MHSAAAPLLACLLAPVSAQAVCFGNSPAGSRLSLGDDSWSVQPMSLGFPFDGVIYNEVTVNSNGYIMLGNVPGSDFTDSEAELLSQGPRIAMCWDDWSPNNAAAGGGVFYDDNGSHVCIVFQGVPAFGSTTRFCNLELRLWPTGQIDLFFDTSMTVPGSSSIVGLSAGNGAAPQRVDLSTHPALAGATGYELFGANTFDLVDSTIEFAPGSGSGYTLSDPTVCIPPGGSNGSLTTTFTSNNGGGVGGGNYFNLTIGASDITFGAIDINSGSPQGTLGSLNIYLISGPGASYVNNTQNGIGPWGSQPVASGAVWAQGADVPSFVALDNSVTLFAGQTYAVALEATGFSFRYTNGDGVPGQPGSGTNQSYSNLDLSLAAGATNNIAFSSQTFDPRICNCTLYYAQGIGCLLAASSLPYGEGCYDQSISYYEEFLPAANDLSGVPGVSTVSVKLTPNGVGGYIVGPGSGLWMGSSGMGNVEGATPGSAPVSTSILNADDGVYTIDLAVNGFTGLINVPGTDGSARTSLTVDSNGSLSIDPALQTDFSPSVLELLSGMNRWAPLWTDLSPNIQGSVHFDIVGSSGYVTWWNVPEFGAPVGLPGNTFQVALGPAGTVELRYDTVIVNNANSLVGFSVGGGAADPGASDIYDPFTMQTNVVDLGAHLTPPALNSSGRPILGVTYDLITSSIDPAASFGTVLVNFVRVVPGIDLGFLGAPGCSAHIDPFANTSLGLFLPAGSPTEATPLTVPTNFAGTEIYFQSVVAVASANPLGIMLSNGLHWRTGTF